MRISKNFKRSEFACKCGCGFDTVDVKLSMLCEFVRNAVKRPLTINSGCRCEKHNKNEDGAKNSKHLLGKAADLAMLSPEEIEKVYEFLCFTFYDRFSFIMYDTFIHVDSRDGMYRDDRRTKK